MVQYFSMESNKQTLGWGKIQADGAEIWDTDPVFLGEQVEFKDWCKLLFFPKKWMLYRYVVHSFRFADEAKRNLSEEMTSDNTKYYSEQMSSDGQHPPTPLKGGVSRVLDVGCGTGASLIDFKKIFGRSVEVYGVDVVALQIDLAKQKIKQNGVWAEVEWYDGEHLSFPDQYFDAIYTSDVLGHVKNVPAWLKELNRVLKPGGALAMFAESKLGKHAYIRNYLMKRGLNTDPHAEFHISLYSKRELKNLLSESGFAIKKMYSAFWASFFVHPDEYYHGFCNTDKHRFFILKNINRLLFWLKKKLHPYSTALCELYGLVEMYLVGKWVEAQGYVILARKE